MQISGTGSKVDAESGDEVEFEDIIKGYEIGKGEYLELDPEELEAVAIDSKRVIDIDEFVPKKEIDEVYLGNPYYIAPDGEVGMQAFAVIREAIKQQGMVAIGKVVFTSREHIIALEPRGKGMMGVTLRYPYEVRKEDGYFDDIPDEKVPKDMLELATHIVGTKAGHFNPEKFDDRYEDALQGTAQEEAVGPKDRAARRARSGESHQPHGCPAPQCPSRARFRRCSQEGKEEGGRTEGNAALDRGQEGLAGAGQEARTVERAATEDRLGAASEGRYH